MNTNEKVQVVINAAPSSREMFDLIESAALQVLKGGPVPEELEDVFTFQIITRPTGSKYVWVQNAPIPT
jgi:hypothetical protein